MPFEKLQEIINATIDGVDTPDKMSIYENGDLDMGSVFVPLKSGKEKHVRYENWSEVDADQILDDLKEAEPKEPEEILAESLNRMAQVAFETAEKMKKHFK